MRGLIDQISLPLISMSEMALEPLDAETMPLMRQRGIII